MVALGCDKGPVIENQPKPSMRLYFEHFKTQTYVPITKEYIEEDSLYKIFFYGKNPFVRDIQTYLEKRKAKKKFDNNSTKLKIVISRENKGDMVYYVDRYGTVEKNNTEIFWLHENELESLEKNILYFHGVVDQKPTLGIKGYNPHEVFPSGYSPILK